MRKNDPSIPSNNSRSVQNMVTPSPHDIAVPIKNYNLSEIEVRNPPNMRNLEHTPDVTYEHTPNRNYDTYHAGDNGSQWAGSNVNFYRQNNDIERIPLNRDRNARSIQSQGGNYSGYGTYSSYDQKIRNTYVTSNLGGIPRGRERSGYSPD